MTETKRGRVLHLDGLRGIAILTVFMVHWARHQLPIFTGGYIGVDVFFVLSGYIITTLLVKRRPTYAQFIGDRVRRLYPPLLGLLVFGTLIVAVWPHAGVRFNDVWRSALVAGAQLMSPWMATGQYPMEPYVITWSLAVEWYFYLLWPFAVALLVKLPLAQAAKWCIGAAIPLYVVGLIMGPQWFYFGPVARFGEMAAGAALAFWTLDGRGFPNQIIRPLAWVAPVFITGWTLIGSDVYSWGYQYIAFPLTITFTLALIVAGNIDGSRHPVVRLLEWKPLVWVGGISYTLYLWHTFPIALIPGGWMGLPMPVLGVIGLAIVGVTTSLGFTLLEKPFRHRRGAELRPGLSSAAPTDQRYAQGN